MPYEMPSAIRNALPVSVPSPCQDRVFRKDYEENGVPHTLLVQVRWDTLQGANKINSFGVTAELYEPYFQRWEPFVKHQPSGRKLWLNSCWCQHDLIRKHFPELAPLLQWHMMSADGPFHYIANTVFLADDRDCWGYRASEQKRDRRTGRPLWQLESPERPHDIISADDQPPPVVLQYQPLMGQGKTPELDDARKAAIWPDASAGQLQDVDALWARLPALMQSFKTDIETIGLVW